MCDCGLRIMGDAVGLFDYGGGVLGREDFVGGLSEESEPAGEVLGVEWELEVSHHGVAFVAAGGEQDGGPEVLEGGEVMRPVADDGVEDGADVGVTANLVVERVDESADLGFGDLVGHVFGHRYSLAFWGALCGNAHISESRGGAADSRPCLSLGVLEYLNFFRHVMRTSSPRPEASIWRL